jgi:hypothetical protein
MPSRILEYSTNNGEFASVGMERTSRGKLGIYMCKLSQDPSSRERRPTRFGSSCRNRGAELAAQADLMLARYPAHVREQITELLQLLVEKPGEQENGAQ